MRLNKLIILPLFMLAIAACDIVDPSSSDSSEETSEESSLDTSVSESESSEELSSEESSSGESSSEESSSEESSQIIYGDNNIYRLAGQFHDANWDTTSEIYRMLRVGDDDIFEITVDMFFGLEWKISINASWEQQIAFSETDNLTIVDTEVTMRGTGGPFHNFVANFDGNYTINLNTEDAPRVLTIERNGDSLTINPDIDHGDWALVGNMNSWNTSNTTYSFVYDSDLEVYVIEQFVAFPGIQFKIVSPTYGWGTDRGFEQVINDIDEDIWLNGTSDGNIQILVAGTYTIVFEWAPRPDGGGTILITQYQDPAP